MLDEAQFWSIIDGSRQRAREQPHPNGVDFIKLHERTLEETLASLSPEEILAFYTRFRECHRRAYRWDLWAAAYWLDGGCSDDAFTDFRACLISLGRRDYEAALADPDSLADVVDRPDAPFMLGEGFQYVAFKVYQKITGAEEWPESILTVSPYPDPIGEQFDFDDDDEMRRRLPRIVAKFPEGMD